MHVLPIAANRTILKDSARRPTAAATWQETEDAQCIARIATGDHDAMAQVFRRYSGLVRSVCRRFLHDPKDVEEVASDTFVYVWKKAAAYRPALGAPAAWIAVIARCRALDRRRALLHYRTQCELEACFDLATSAPGPEDLCIVSQYSARIRMRMTRLPKAQRKAIELAYFSGMSHAEIATHTGVPLGSAKTRVRQGLLHLRRAMSR
jgi:RNA polymerase sigma-70 factor (ECF subfamily)